MGIKCPKCHSDNPNDTLYCGKCAAPLKSAEKISITKTIITPTEGLQKGSIIAGKYQILEELGRGGMGIVYKAEDTKLKRTVALKFLPPELTHIAEVKERFMREAQAAAALDHPNICTVHEFDEVEEKTYISMAYIEGQSLKRKIESGQLELEEAIRLATQVAEGLQEAHKKGVVHRDIKSANIMVTEKDQAKVMDFGLARVTGGTLVTQEGMVMGTIAYMSPEQARGEDVDHRTDIWSFGVVMYEMLSGQLPFKGEKDSSIIYSIEHREPTPLKEIKPEIPEELVQVVGKALTKNPQERYQQIEDLLNDLYSISKGFVPPKIKAAIRRARLLKIKRAYLYGGIVALSVLLIAAGLYFFSLRGKAIASIAVLPFENTSGDPDVEYLSDGVTETLINRLSKLQKIKKVIARTSVDAYKGQSIDPKKVGKELNVQVVLTGKMLQRGNELSISVELASTRDNSHLWGDKYNRRIDDIFEIEEDIATEISQVLRLELTGEEKKQLAKRYTQDKEAYLLFLKGRYFMNKLTEEGFKKGIEFYNQAIDKDPNYALAYVGLAQFYIKSGMFGIFPPNEVYPRAKVAVEKAIEIDETLAEAQAWDGALSQWYEWDWSAAEKKFKRAIEMNLNNSEELGFYSWYLSCMRRYEEAIAIDHRCLELDPLSPYENIGRGYTYFLAGRYDEAIVWMKKALELDSNYFYAYIQIARCYIAKGLYEEAIAEFNKAEEIYPQLDPGGIADKALIYATSGRRNEAIIALNKLTKLSKQRYVDPILIGCIHASLDETDKAFEWLDKAFEVRSPGLVLLRTEAHNFIFKNINSDPRYKALLKRMNLE